MPFWGHDIYQFVNEIANLKVGVVGLGNVFCKLWSDLNNTLTKKNVNFNNQHTPREFNIR